MTDRNPAQTLRLGVWILSRLHFAAALFFAWLSIHRGVAVGPAFFAIGFAILAIMHVVLSSVVQERLKTNASAKLSMKIKILVWTLGVIGLFFLVTGNVFVLFK